MRDPDQNTATALTSAAGADGVLTLTGLVNVLLRQSRLIASVAALAVLVAIIVSFARAAYVARASFTSANQGSGMQGLALVAQSFGVDVGAAAGSAPSLDFYVSVLQSRQLLSDLLRSDLKYQAPIGKGDSVVTTLLDVYGYQADTSRRAMLKAVERLRRDLDVTSDPASNLVSFSVRARNGALAEAVGRRLLDLINQFNVQQLQSSAAAERKFAQERADLAARQLQASEDSLRRFLEQNRSITASPRLRFEEQRLQRNIGLRQQLYTSLAQSLEQARIAEVRDIPVITVVDAPEGSALRSRHLIRNTIVALLLGLVLGIIAAVGREHLRLERAEHPAEYDEFVTLRQQVFRRPWRAGRSHSPPGR